MERLLFVAILTISTSCVLLRNNRKIKQINTEIELYQNTNICKISTVNKTSDEALQTKDTLRFGNNTLVTDGDLLFTSDLKNNDKVKEMAESGIICEVFGHSWRSGRHGEYYDPETGLGGSFLDSHPNISYRTCIICGKTQTQDRNWK